MSLAIFENFLKFAEGAVAAKAMLPSSIDPNEFESALVSHGVVLLHAHMEQCLRKAIDARCARCSDPEIKTYAVSVRRDTSGKLKIEAIKGSLTRFSDAYKKAFSNHLSASGLATSWDSVVNHRHDVAHEGNPAQLTLKELRLYYDHVRRVLGFLCDGLTLTAVEVGGISNLITNVPPIAQSASASQPLTSTTTAAAVPAVAPPTANSP